MPDNFYVAPLGGMDLAGAVGDAVEGGRDNYRKMQIQKRLPEVLKSGDPDKMYDFVSEYPEATALVQQAAGFKDNQEIQQRVDAAKRILINKEDPIMVAQDLVNANPQDPQFLKSLEEAKADRNASIKRAERVLALNAPKAWESYRKQEGIGSGGDIESFVGLEKKKWLQENPGKTEADIPPQILQDAYIKAKRQTVDERLETTQGQKDIGLEMDPQITAANKQAELEVIKSMQPGIERDKAMATHVAAAEVARAQDTINKGLTAAESLPILKRSLDLLDRVETGGFDNVRLEAKRFFGVEGADEGELSNALAKAVLSQLKATFGAQFTVEEGKRLERIEAGFSKSPANNKRLLRQAVLMSQRKVDAALKRAEEMGDTNTIEQINTWLEHDLTPLLDGGDTPAAPPSYKEGDIVQDGQGNRLILRNNQWVPMTGGM